MPASTANALPRIAALDLVTATQLADLRERIEWKGIALIVHAWAVIFGAMALVAVLPNPLTYTLAVMLIGSRQLGLAILMHEAAHKLLFTNKRVNDWVGRWLLGFPSFTPV